jgi:hypothetical protein
MDAEAPPRAAGRASMVDWVGLAKLVGPVTLDRVSAAFPDWLIGQDGKWLWAVRRTLETAPAPDSPLSLVIIAYSPIGLAEQLDTQEHLRAHPGDAFTLLTRIAGAAR